MAEVQPFRAYRYDLGRVGSLSSVIAPPYDVIDESLLKKLGAMHANNVVHIDLPKPEATDKNTDECYARAGKRFKDWFRDGILKQDSARSLYVYHQDFESGGKMHTRRGVLARVRLERFDSGVILAHEDTLAGPKLDRLRLLEATSTNLSPGFGLYNDNGEVQATLDAAIAGQPPTEATDLLGVRSRIWQITDQQVISKVVGLLGPKPLLIADGHHRYETSLQYRDQILGDASTKQGDDPVRYTMMMLVGMSDPGLLVLPTHRLVTGCGKLTATDLSTRLAPCFDVKQVGSGREAAESAWEQVSEIGQGGLAFGLADGTWWVARPRDLSKMSEYAADHTEAWRKLSVSVLHRLVLDRLIPPASGKKLACEYVHQWEETVDGMTKGTAELAVLVPAVDVRTTEAIAAGGERMPPKSTYFYPKLQTGLVFNPLNTN